MFRLIASLFSRSWFLFLLYIWNVFVERLSQKPLFSIFFSRTLRVFTSFCFRAFSSAARRLTDWINGGVPCGAVRGGVPRLFRRSGYFRNANFFFIMSSVCEILKWQL
jgi:hypothetical protein